MQVPEDSSGYSGDNGAATSSKLYQAFYIALDTAGNLYIADSGNYCIRKVDHITGIITTVAGTGGSSGYSGDNGPAVSAVLYNQWGGVAVDSAGNIYIGDRGNSRVRKVDTSGIITTVAGTATAGYSGDGGLATASQLDHSSGVAIDSAGNLYICDENNECIRRVP